MNEDLYLQRLKNIRDKYSSVTKTSLELKNSNFAYRPYPANPEQSMLRQKLEGTSTRPRPAQYEQSSTTYTPVKSVERSYSHAKHTPTPVSNNQNSNAGPSQKRMDNFSAFIRDLDQRIQEKERALNSKIRMGQSWKQKEKEDVEYDVLRTINRYSSSKDIKPSNIPENISRVVPREAYQRSLAKRQEIQSRAYQRSLGKRQQVQSRRAISNHDIENVLQRKWLQEGVTANEKMRLIGAYKSDKLKINQHASPLGISKQENIILYDNWSLGKLDSIQKRIKAVLG